MATALFQYRCDCIWKVVFFINDTSDAVRKVTVDDYNTDEAFEKSLKEHGGRIATERVHARPDGAACLIRQGHVRTGTKVHVLGDSTCFLYKYYENDMDAAKAAWDEVNPHMKKFNEKTGRWANKKSSTFEKGYTWQLFIAHACIEQRGGPPTEYANGGSVKVAAHGGATPGDLADALDLLAKERDRTQNWPDVQITITKLNGFSSKKGSCPWYKPAGYQETCQGCRTFTVSQHLAPYCLLAARHEFGVSEVARSGI